MGLHLMAALDGEQLSHWLLVILQAAAGLGLVIFVHELGHFAVARLCGVKCEKFMIGFDVGGLKLSRRWGETEYGIGIVPFGGYVQMLGQDDNPANIDEQLKQSIASSGTVETKSIVGPDGQTYQVDARSYMAKSVPQRMAIISAGVVMNVIFAVVFAVLAYKIGVPYHPSIVSRTAPGSPAWQADIRPDDEIVMVDGVKNPSFEELRGGVMLGNLEAGVPFVIRRGEEEIAKTLRPEQSGGLPRVGITPPYSLRLNKEQPAIPDTEAAVAQPPLVGGDEITAVDGQSVASYAQFVEQLARRRDQAIELTVRRGKKEEISVRVEPRPLQELGLAMQWGRVAAVQENSPAAAAGLQAGDFIERLVDASDAQSDAAPALGKDPLLLPQEIRRLAHEGRELHIRVRRDTPGSAGRQQAQEMVVSPRPLDRDDSPLAKSDPLSIPAIGAAIRVLTVVASVAPDSPAAQAGLQQGDVVTRAEFVYPAGTPRDRRMKPIDFGRDERSVEAQWPWFVSVLQFQPPGTTVKISYARGEETVEATLTPAPVAEEFELDRGFAFDPVERTRKAATWGEAMRRGWDETVSSLGMVYRFLSKLGTQVPLTELGGPLTIAQAAGSSAFQGFGKLLTFLTMLSANLAVINFLPIPVLDGGHMVFLAWEGLRGRPAGKSVALAMQTAGLVFILTLMLFVLSLDVRRLFFA